MAKKWLAAVLGAVAVTVGLGSGASVASPDAKGDALAAFERIREQQADAWFREDAVAFAATYTKNADLVTFNGDHLQTRDGIAKGMAYYFDKYIDHTRLKMLSEDVRFVAPDLAVIVRSSCQLVPPSTECRQDSYSRNTNVMVKRNGKWLQESFQNTRIVALP
jgi:uncharacterized protein (TIGR02246 family)